MGPLSSPVVTSYGLPIVTVGLSLAVFEVLRLVTDRQTDGRMELVGTALFTKCIDRRKLRQY